MKSSLPALAAPWIPPPPGRRRQLGQRRRPHLRRRRHPRQRHVRDTFPGPLALYRAVLPEQLAMPEQLEQLGTTGHTNN